MVYLGIHVEIYATDSLSVATTSAPSNATLAHVNCANTFHKLSFIAIANKLHYQTFWLLRKVENRAWIQYLVVIKSVEKCFSVDRMVMNIIATESAMLALVIHVMV